MHFLSRYIVGEVRLQFGKVFNLTEVKKVEKKWIFWKIITKSFVKGSGYEYKVQAIPKCIKRNLWHKKLGNKMIFRGVVGHQVTNSPWSPNFLCRLKTKMYKSLGDNWKKWAAAAGGLKCQQQIFKLPTFPSFLSILYRCWIIPSGRSQDIIGLWRCLNIQTSLSLASHTDALKMTLSLTLNLGNPLARGSRHKGCHKCPDSQVRIPHISQDTPVFVYWWRSNDTSIILLQAW